MFFFNKQKGASMLEYGLIAALIAVVCISAITALGKESSYSSFLTYAAQRPPSRYAYYGSCFNWAKAHVENCRNNVWNGTAYASTCSGQGMIDWAKDECP